MVIKANMMSPTLILMEMFGSFVARRRDELGYSQRTLAKKVRLSHVRLGEIERGLVDDIKLGTFLAIARALKVKPIDLLAIYEGKDPDNIDQSFAFSSIDEIVEAFREFMKERVDH